MVNLVYPNQLRASVEDRNIFRTREMPPTLQEQIFSLVKSIGQEANRKSSAWRFRNSQTRDEAGSIRVQGIPDVMGHYVRG